MRNSSGIKSPDSEKIDRCAVLMHPCNCIGPQDGQPLCPCRMRGVIVKNGRYVIPEQDLGPVRDHPKSRNEDNNDWLKVHVEGKFSI